MDHRRQAILRRAEILQQPLDAAERQIDLLGMQIEQAFETRIRLPGVRLNDGALMRHPATRGDA